MTASRLTTPDRAPLESEAPTLVALLARAARHERAESHGLRFLDRREAEAFVTWRVLAERAQRVARALVARGVERAERVALIFPTGPEFFDAFFGTLLAGAVPAPLYPPFRLGSMDEYERRTAAMIEATSARLVLADATVRRLLGGVTARVRPRLGCATLGELAVPSSLAAPGPLGHESPAGDEPLRGDELALVQFSSGTTGRPKPVALTHSAILHQARLLNSHWPDEPGLEQAGVSWLPLYHDMGLIGCVLPALMRPATLTLLGPELFIARPAAWLRAISRYRATVSPAPNFAYALAAERIRDDELQGVDLSTWRAALNGAEAVSGPALRRFAERFSSFGLRPEALTPVYGLAEAALAVTFSPLERAYRSEWFDRVRLGEGVALPRRPHATVAGGAATPDSTPDSTLDSADSTADTTEHAVEVVSVGLPVPGFEIEVRAEDAAAAGERPLPVGCVGRIFARGPSLMSGYLGQPLASAAVLAGGWLDTGDRGFVHGGELWVVGRSKDVLVVHGRNHDPEPVERAVGAVAGVRTGCVVAVSHLPAAGEVEELLVLAELRRDAGRGSQARGGVETACRQRVLAETGLRLDRLVLLDPGALPRTSSGKLRRCEALERLLRGELAAAPERGPVARLARRLGEQPAVQAARALARSSRLARGPSPATDAGALDREEP
jgi:acyl-CoA synthetase (AMP-forming)/AMP-acid ligase II